MTATLLAVGYNSHEIQTFLSQDLSSVFLDHVCGACSIPLNVKLGYGWNPGRKILQWFKKKIKNKTKNEDITFKMLYESKETTFIKELCIIVTNINEMSAEYCHVKTFPHMKIVEAVRMSMSLPGVYQAFQYKHNGIVDIKVDGGILCNYPIHCFDGWWLSMEEGNSFMERLHPLKELPDFYQHSKRFGEFDNKTLGFVLFSEHEQDVFRFELEKRFYMPLEDLSGTVLSDKYHKKKEEARRAENEHGKLVKAVEHFLQSVRKHNSDEDRSTIVKTELINALDDKEAFPTSDRQLIFGDVDNGLIMQYLDLNDDGKIDYHELVAFVEEAGVQIRSRVLGYQRKDVNGVLDFMSSLISTVIANAKKAGFKKSDLVRTVAINTGHVCTFDFVLEDEDRAFVVERGRQATLTFLKYYVVNNKLPKKTSRDRPTTNTRL
ncbi:uncharacterized protein LOC121380415 isoform X2 [Gigantopelta aegis]|nr:uncharacterized protein LOC121380415 isoform X2 [Gigantopelta aegis]